MMQSPIFYMKYLLLIIMSVMRRLSFVVVMIIQVVILQSVVASSAAVSSDINSMQFRPLGWVEEFLNRQVSGLTGHPEESGFPFDRGGWIGGLDYTEREIKGGQELVSL